MTKKQASDSEESFEADEAGFGEETHNLLLEDSDVSDDAQFAHFNDGRLRLRQNISLDEPEYAGVKSSRKDVFEEDDRLVEEEAYRSPFNSDNEFVGEPADVDEDMEAIDQEYEELQKEEEEMLRTLKDQTEGDTKKGRAVRNQKELWDRALDTRIAIQKVLTDANSLPEVDSVDPEAQVREDYENLKSSALRTLQILLDLEDAIVEQNGEIQLQKGGNEKQNSSTKGNDLDSAWDRLTLAYTRFVPYRDQALDRWHRKTQISSGAAASRGKLKAFNQSISQQVANAMKDPSRLVNRMLSTKPVVGKEVTNEEPNSLGEAEPEAPDCFDDSEFYQQLLREFLESADPNALGVMNHEAIRKLRNKKRKIVDRRASKGRKIRYTVHEPLMNFMAPEPMSLPPMATKLFESLFGNRSTAMEAAA